LLEPVPHCRPVDFKHVEKLGGRLRAFAPKECKEDMLGAESCAIGFIS
jgi:hypothetical protein